MSSVVSCRGNFQLFKEVCDVSLLTYYTLHVEIPKILLDKIHSDFWSILNKIMAEADGFPAVNILSVSIS